MAPIPDVRLKAQYAFQNTGVDYFGPFTFKQADQEVKAYGVLFTCAVTRAVHLEVAESLNSSSFLNALRRFIARRGPVECMISDNGTNFGAAHDIMRKELGHLIRLEPEIARELSKRSIKWTFNAPGASHHGGFFERLVRSIKQILGGLMNRASRLSYEALNTLLCECEAIMNARPLTVVSDDVDELEALTPNHLLIGRPGGIPPPRGTQHRNIATALRMQWKAVQHLATTFWKCWYLEYRSLLHNRTKWHVKANRELENNDVVIIADPTRPREQWKLGRVVSITRSARDGHIRVAEVKTSSGIITRPITKLCLLETASLKNANSS